ncbi:hypothetical protein P7K49_004773 [Saguinus oedipus]|uniref:Uncharacterized protein n=1 Tax=Saguinus oedipus TaxID=9490 RepID=A0ABQ9W8G1_SAGOE|nr:hypothetical protein P7K49_004773 [Saguinus oedipus]
MERIEENASRGDFHGQSGHESCAASFYQMAWGHGCTSGSIWGRKVQSQVEQSPLGYSDVPGLIKHQSDILEPATSVSSTFMA